MKEKTKFALQNTVIASLVGLFTGFFVGTVSNSIVVGIFVFLMMFWLSIIASYLERLVFNE